MQENNENYEQISLFVDANTVVDSRLRKKEKNLRDKTISLAQKARLNDQKCAYEVYLLSPNKKCVRCGLIENGLDEHKIQPDEKNCGTFSCPYFIPCAKGD